MNIPKDVPNPEVKKDVSLGYFGLGRYSWSTHKDKATTPTVMTEA